jgi:hypothetical protein
MKAWVYRKARDLGEARFADCLDPASTAVVSIDMHRDDLQDSPQCRSARAGRQLLDRMGHARGAR